MKTNPNITQNFVKYLKNKSEDRLYRVDVDFNGKTIPIDVFPTVFPPKSDYSVSSKSLYNNLGDITDKKVLDIGCGSGIESIVAAKLGAKHVDAVDINENAIDCTRHNVMINGLEEVISVFESNLFSAITTIDYDVIIANLPIVNFNAEENKINNALYDNDFKLHKRLFKELKDYLSPLGFVTFSHANLQSKKTNNPMSDFDYLEDLIREYDLRIINRVRYEDLGYDWINYKISK